MNQSTLIGNEYKVYTRSKEKISQGAAVKLALNRKVQGGGFWLALGFPSCGHAHQQARETSGGYIIGSRT